MVAVSALSLDGSSVTSCKQARLNPPRRAACFYSLGLALVFSLPCAADPRQVFDANSPAWLQAVGKLTVPGYRYQNGDRRHHQQHCTATLIASNVILSGWHCLEHYTDLSQDIVFTLPYSAKKISRTARRLEDGGGMHADWSLLKLNKPISKKVAVAVPVGTVNAGEPGLPTLTLAGYSRDKGVGASGRRLSYHADCAILHNESYRVATNCMAFKGSSGGPVVYDRAIVGVVSEGDSERLSFYTPSRCFYSAVKRYLD